MTAVNTRSWFLIGQIHSTDLGIEGYGSGGYCIQHSFRIAPVSTRTPIDEENMHQSTVTWLPHQSSFGCQSGFR